MTRGPFAPPWRYTTRQASVSVTLRTALTNGPLTKNIALCVRTAT